MSLTKWSSKISSVAGPVKTTNLAVRCENSVSAQTFIRGLWSAKISPVAGPARPSNHHKPFKLGLHNFVRGRPSQDHGRDNLGGQKSVTGRPSKDHEPYQMEPQNFTRGNSTDHKPHNLELAGPAKTMSLTKWSSKISSAAGPVKTTNLAICITKILSLAGPAKTMSLIDWSSKISSAAGPVKTTNLAIWSTKFCHWQAQQRP